jgi:Lrp/AsnC family transcriptional regulator, leucine-responsive regulatory protein
VRHRSRVMEPDRGTEVARKPLSEPFGVHPALSDPAIQLQVGCELVGIGLSCDWTDPRPRASNVVRDALDSQTGGLRVIVHQQQYASRPVACDDEFGLIRAQLRNDLPMDDTDRAILRHLQADGRLPNAALAERVHLSPSPCLRRLKRLEDTGAIRGYRAILDRRKIGLGLTAFVEVKVAGQSRRRADELEKAVAKIDEIVACYIVAGDADFMLEVVASDLAEYEQLLLHKVLDLPGVSNVRSNFTIRTVKEPGPLPVPR